MPRLEVAVMMYSANKRQDHKTFSLKWHRPCSVVLNVVHDCEWQNDCAPPTTDITPFTLTAEAESHLVNKNTCCVHVAISNPVYDLSARPDLLVSGFSVSNSWSLYSFVSKDAGFWRQLFLVAATHNTLSALIFVGCVGSKTEHGPYL
jgi:hypothetical protein